MTVLNAGDQCWLKNQQMFRQREANAKWHIKSQYDPKRQELNLKKSHIIDYSYLKALAEMALPLRILSLYKNELSAEDLKALQLVEWTYILAGPSYHINKIDLNKIRCSGVLNLSKAKMPNLSSLELRGCEIEGKGVKYLAQMRLPHLAHLSLGNNRIGTVGAQGLSISQWPRLRRLNLYGNAIQDRGLLFLSRSIWQNIQEILLDDNQLTRQGFKALTHTAWSNVFYIGLNFNEQEVGEPDQKMLAQRYPNLQLRQAKRYT